MKVRKQNKPKVLPLILFAKPPEEEKEAKKAKKESTMISDWTRSLLITENRGLPDWWDRS